MRAQIVIAAGGLVSTLSVCALCGCHARQETGPVASGPSAATASVRTADLRPVAGMPHVIQRYSDFTNALQPLRVYSHNGNTVLVLSDARGQESGQYLLSAFASYLPFDGQDGFRFRGRLIPTYVEGGPDTRLALVLDYARSQPVGPANSHPLAP